MWRSTKKTCDASIYEKQNNVDSKQNYKNEFVCETDQPPPPPSALLPHVYNASSLQL